MALDKERWFRLSRLVPILLIAAMAALWVWWINQPDDWDVCNGGGGDSNAPEYAGEGPHPINDTMWFSTNDLPEGWVADNAQDAQLEVCHTGMRKAGVVSDCEYMGEGVVAADTHTHDFTVRSIHDGHVVAKFSVVSDECPGSILVENGAPEADPEAEISPAAIKPELKPIVTEPAEQQD